MKKSNLSPEQRRTQQEKRRLTIEGKKAKLRYEQFLKRPEWPQEINDERYQETIGLLSELQDQFEQLSKDHFESVQRYDAMMSEMRAEKSSIDITGSERYGVIRDKMYEAVKSQFSAGRKMALLSSLKWALIWRGSKEEQFIFNRHNN
jgi:hypothetical protein